MKAASEKAEFYSPFIATTPSGFAGPKAFWSAPEPRTSPPPERRKRITRASPGPAAEPGNHSQKWNRSWMVASNRSAFGIYPDQGAVEQAVIALKDSGFRNTDISVLVPDNVGTKDFAHQKSTKAPEGAVAGGSIGALIGGSLGYL